MNEYQKKQDLLKSMNEDVKRATIRWHELEKEISTRLNMRDSDNENEAAIQTADEELTLVKIFSKATINKIETLNQELKDLKDARQFSDYEKNTAEKWSKSILEDYKAGKKNLAKIFELCEGCVNQNIGKMTRQKIEKTLATKV